MLQRFITIGLLITVFFSCETETIAKFEIENNTSTTIDSLRIVPNGYESDYYISLSSGQLKKYDCNMTDIADVDGDYRLDYKFVTSLFETKTFGYYTNGYPIEKLIRISIETDTIIVDYELNTY
ncbi:Uncharacterised protein [Candidatus Ornithobacterium hominis]|uniref:hypothetical protein n=1 Tax=Candidatus Ornithobacterium hominis TaxID=2497989 RepID=UPI000E9A9578|nr:hypothetical protein [Candidatus Ornithobacterium hominis]SZD73861.1 Uncharacterised protein [Candidatus Ornithobacterium hominis]